MKNKRIWCAAVAALAVLGACGGGGGGSTDQPSVASTYAVAAAERNWLRTPRSYQSQSPYAPIEGTFVTTSLAITPMDAVQLPSLSTSAVERASLFGNSFTPGIARPTSTFRSVEYFEGTPLRYLGRSVYDVSAVIPAEQATAMPETATIGASGPLYTLPATSNAGTTFQDSLSWSLEPDGPQTAWLCHHYATRQTPATGTSQVRDLRLCVKIDPAGTISDFKSDDVTS